MRGSIVFMLWLSVLAATAQNLVPNPGFEEFTSCPGSYSRRKEELKLVSWYSPAGGTPDAFNSCASGEGGVPYNWAGVSEAFDGNGYAGVYAWMRGRDFREYLQTRLSHPLISDTTYIVSFRYKLSSYAKFCVNRIGLHLSDTGLLRRHDRSWKIKPILSVAMDSALTLTTGLWEEASLEYRARGGEEFVTIGNFYGDDSTKVYEIRFRPVQEDMLREAAYYYIDDVVVSMKFQSTPFNQDIPVFIASKVDVNERYVLNNVTFDFNSHKLLRRSYAQLDEVVSILKKNADFQVEISGYTDDVGSDQYNLVLSEKRANTVALYLKQNGIHAGRISAAGFGKQFPLIEGFTDEARSINRRVELRFTTRLGP